MAYNYEFPYVDPNRSNSDWILAYVKDAKAFLGSYKEKLEALEAKDTEIQSEIDKINTWISELDNNYIGEALKKFIATMIFVEINDAGYIQYSIPERWRDITFNTTGLDINLSLQPEYGHLVLSY